MNWSTLLAAVFGSCVATVAWAGPPYLTDDPEPTPLHHYEIYAFASGSRIAGDFNGLTGLDLNYGALPGVQLTATLPVDFSSAAGSRTGFGDAEAGVKYRFYNDERRKLSFAIFPRVIVPTARGSRRAALLLPLWGQVERGAWTIFGGGGLAIDTGSGHRFGTGGVAVTHAFSDRVSAGAEVAHRSPDEAGARSYTALNFGATIGLWGPFALLVSGGPGVGHARDGGTYNVYAALAANF